MLYSTIIVVMYIQHRVSCMSNAGILIPACSSQFAHILSSRCYNRIFSYYTGFTLFSKKTVETRNQFYDTS